jgi:hypothetical protein
MPTIDELAPATAASDTDELVASQSGVARKLTRAQVVSGLQPALSVPSGTLLGRQSSGTGAPETLTIGGNLVLNGGTLSAATEYVVNALPLGTVPAAGNLVAMGQGGVNTAVPYGQFMSGLPGVPGVDASQTLVTPTGATASQKLADFAAGTLPTAGGTLAGALTLAANPTTPLQAATKQYVDMLSAAALPTAGGFMTGSLTLAADPATAMQAATKEYVDAHVATALPLGGGTMTGLLALASDPVAASQATTKHYVDSQVATAVPVAGGVMTGALMLAVDPTASLQAATKHYVDTSTASALPLVGGSLTGPLTLSADPTASLQAATKHYVDSAAAAGIPVTGATMTGALLLSGNPSVPLQAAPKQYVDTQTATALPKSGGTLTGSLTLAADPTAALQAATKEYVDAQVATALPKSGGTLTGALSTLSTGTSVATGNNVGTFDTLAAQFSFRRQVMSGNPGQATVYVGLTNFSNQYASYYSTGEYVDVPAMIIQAQNVPGSTGQLNGLQILMNSGGNNPFDAEDQGLNVQVVKAGQNSTWAINTQSLDTTGLPPQAFATVGAEIDLGGSGYDTAASAYDPYQSNRATMWFNGRPYPWPNWTASTAYGVGAIVVATPVGGVPSTYIAQNAGTSGTAAPTWPTSGTVADNGVTWQYGTTFAFSIGRGIWFDSNVGPNQFQWGTCISGDAIVQNAFLDTQRVTFSSSGGAAIRLAANQVIDFTGNLSAAGQNQHTLQYSSYDAGLAYNIGTSGVVTSLCLKDNFQVSVSGVTSIANTTKGNLSGITTGYNPAGLTIGWNYAANSETDLMVDANGVNIYPVSAAGTTPALPIFSLNGSGSLKAFGSLTAGTTLSVAGAASLANTVSGSLHGITSGYVPQGLTVGWSYANTGETDLMVGANGLNVYPISASGTTPASPIFALSGSGGVTANGPVSANTTLSVAGVVSLANTVSGSLHGITSGYVPQGLTVGWNYANNGETDFIVDANGLNIYPVSAAGTISASPIFALSGSGGVTAYGAVSANTTLSVGTTLTVSGIAALAVTASGGLHGITSGYSPQGLTVGWSYANTGETDLMVGANGLNVYPISSSGTAPATPIFTLGGPGNLKAYGSVTAGTTLSVAGVASLANTVAGGLNGITSGYNPQGLTVGWSYANAGETDLMVGANGLNVYTVSSGGVSASSPIFALSGAGVVSLLTLKASASYANDAAAATGGVAVGQLYRNGSVVQIRIS